MTAQLNEQLQTTHVLWNLKDLYESTGDSIVGQDISSLLDRAKAIRSRYAGRLTALSDVELLALVTELEAISILLGKLSTFAGLNFATQTRSAQAAAFLQRLREVQSAAGKELVFFDLEWANLPEEVAAPLLASPQLSHYRHYLANVRRYQPHLLSETEEVLLVERAPVGRASWTTLFTKVLGHLTFGEKGRSEEEVLADLYLPEREKRCQAAADLTSGLRSQLHVLTHVFNTLLADKMIDDRLRSYGSWLSAMNLDNELRDETVATLVAAVVGRYDIPTRYYQLKRQLLDLPELLDYDRYAPLPHLPSAVITWPECREMVLTAFGAFSPEMAEIGTLFFDRGWIHAPLLEGKRSGAFAHPCIPEKHPYILVNYTGNLRDVSTVAHELGHGIHQYLAAKQGYFNSQTPLVLAETASVFAELLVFNSQLERLIEPRERTAFICQKLESIFATVFRQVAMNRFEDLVHTGRRGQGELAAEEISKKWLATQRQMFGESVTLTENYSIWWSYIPHFLSAPGYVYSYAFGELLVLALYRLYQQGERERFVAAYIGLLAAGGSRSPYELLTPFGVDPDDPAFWQGGLEIIDAMLSQAVPK